jgi:N-acetylmuramoyl-L-alanine amidase
MIGVLLAVIGGDTVGAKTYCERLYESARRDYYSLLKSERNQRFHDSWERVINKFDGIVDKYPQCSKAPDSLFNMGVLYRKLYRKSWLKKDLVKARENFEYLAKSYPESKLADDALLSAAEILEEMGNKKEAYRAYTKVRSAYPKGDMSAKAKKKLSELSAYAPRPDPVRPTRPISGKFNLSDVKYWSNPNYTRIVVYGSGQLKFEKHSLKRDPVTGKPPRIYIDMKGAVLPKGIDNSLAIKDGLLHQARIAQYNSNTVRLVLDMESVKDSTASALQNPSRLVVDIYGEGQAAEIGKPGTALLSPGSNVLPLSQQLGLKIKRIVLDPGHGGKDPGAVGRKGLREKDVVLALAKRIKPRLEARGYEVLLTRSSDVFIELKDRARFANDNKADLFVSIHTNASKNRKARGIETYFLGVARDRQSSETAMLENAVSGENALSDLEQILHSLMNQNNMWHSSILAETVQESMYGGLLNGKYGTIKNLGVKQAPFFVLSKTAMPAVLVETSFISNSSEEKLLQRGDFRDTLSDSITRGIINYTKKVTKQEGSS